jgi:hypothetical protein
VDNGLAIDDNSLPSNPIALETSLSKGDRDGETLDNKMLNRRSDFLMIATLVWSVGEVFYRLITIDNICYHACNIHTHISISLPATIDSGIKIAIRNPR